MPISLKNVAVNAFDKTGNILLSPPLGGIGQIHNHGPRSQQKITLTFDDGPSRPCTEVLLDALAELEVKATFFCCGMNVTWHPDLVERAFKEGHDIGNHSMYHSRKAGIQPWNKGEHIDRGAAEISKVIGVQPLLYRPPWGWLTPWEGNRLIKRGYTIIGWDVYTLDWQFPEVNGIQIAEKAIQDTRPGSILLFHDAVTWKKYIDKNETIRAVRHMIPALREAGFEFVKVSELLQVPAYSINP